MKKIISMVLALVMVMGLSVTAMAVDPVETKDEQPGKVTVRIQDIADGKNYTGKIEVPATGDVTSFADATITDTYYVVMDWTVKSTLTYTVGQDGYKWNVYGTSEGSEVKLNGTKNTTPPTHARYDVDGKWTGEATITVNVANWSNVDITATPSWASGKKADNRGVTKDMVIIGLDGLGFTPIDSAAKGKTPDSDAVTTANVTPKTVFNKTIKTDTTSECRITDGAIIDTDNQQNAIIGTLTVTIAKAASTPGN